MCRLWLFSRCWIRWATSYSFRLLFVCCLRCSGAGSSMPGRMRGSLHVSTFILLLLCPVIPYEESNADSGKFPSLRSFRRDLNRLCGPTSPSRRHRHCPSPHCVSTNNRLIVALWHLHRRLLLHLHLLYSYLGT